ncbi:MAG: methyltransferase domain-containing protein [Anaerolineales bacterium]|nr:methyltransferase domain-containing protein [Anaerolineales bacterium]
MRFFYFLLYHPLAFTYDLVAWVVSFGKWNDWVLSIFPLIEGTRILELGHGPGHLQRFLLDRGLSPVALDESTQMGRLAKRRLGGKHKLARGLAQSLPFPTDHFDTVVSTFPSEYIFEAETLAEIRRVLTPAGRLVILPVAFPSNGFLKWLYKVTGETPEELDNALKERVQQAFEKAGFEMEAQVKETKESRLVILLARG